MVVDPLRPQAYWNDGPILHLVNESDVHFSFFSLIKQSIIQFRCSHLPSLLNHISNISNHQFKYLSIINPLSHPVLPTSLHSPDQQQHYLPPPSIKSEYSRLSKGNPQDQVFHITSLLSYSIPTYQSFLPIMSFITQDDYYDLPIPLLPDYILSFREIIPCSF